MPIPRLEDLTRAQHPATSKWQYRARLPPPIIWIILAARLQLRAPTQKQKMAPLPTNQSLWTLKASLSPKNHLYSLQLMLKWVWSQFLTPLTLPRLFLTYRSKSQVKMSRWYKRSRSPSQAKSCQIQMKMAVLRSNPLPSIQIPTLKL